MELMRGNSGKEATEESRRVLTWLHFHNSNFRAPQLPKPQTLLTGKGLLEDGASGSQTGTHMTTNDNSIAKTQKSVSSSPILSSEAENSQALRKPWLKLGRFAIPKASWPEPHLSIGTKCNRMGQNECWEAIGPAKVLFTEIAENIGTLLDDRMDELEEGEPVAVDILTFGMYMIGKTPRTAQPTLLFTCQRQKPRRRAIKFMKESSILKGKPNIALAESSVVPTATNNNYLRLLARDTASTEMREVGGGILWNSLAAAPTEPPELARELPISIFGVAVICASTRKKTTIGGLVQVNKEYFGLTVAHGFEAFSGSPVLTPLGSSSKPPGGDPEFAFDNNEDELGDAENAFDESDVAITSQASVSSLAATLARSATTSTRRSGIQDDDESTITITPDADPGPDCVFLDEEGSTIYSGSFQAAIKIGDLSVSSAIQGSHLGLDWALIALNDNALREVQARSLKAGLFENIVLPKRVVPRLERDAAIVALRGHGVISRGSISSSTTMMRLPHDNRFQELWTVRLDSSLIEGDSGAWIIDAITGDLYGQIVAGLSGGGAAYVIPAYKIFDDINRTFGPTELVSNSKEAITGENKEQQEHSSQMNSLVEGHKYKEPSVVDLKDAHTCSCNCEAANTKNLALRRNSPKWEEPDSSDDDSGYDTIGFSSMGGNSTRIPSPPRLQVFEEAHLGYTVRHIFQRSLRNLSGGDSSNESEMPFKSQPLVTQNFDSEMVLQHLRQYPFDENSHELLAPLRIRERVLTQQSLWDYKVDDYEIVDIYSSEKCCQVSGTLVETFLDAIGVSSKPIIRNESPRSIFGRIINEPPRSIFGRLMSIQKPSPTMLGMLHKVLISEFDMDEIFKLLAGETISMSMSRPYASDSRQQRTLIFSFKYFTIIGDDCSPEYWQRSDNWKRNESRKIDTKEHIPLSTCTSVLALSLSGQPIQILRDSRKRRNGAVYSIWSPWQVLNIRCYPDHHSTFEFEPQEFATGPEAFLARLLAEFRDAQRRFDDIHAKIQKLIYPTNDSFLFDADLRDRLLFENENFTYSRRYFWAYQTLGIIQENIRAIVRASKDTFTDKVWNGRHPTLWPLVNDDEPRAKEWTKRIDSLRKKFNAEIDEFERKTEKIEDTRKDIRQLRDQLFNGTSILESRKSVELSAVTSLQSHNIKLLTLVSVFFLPLTFVTSVFGMSNMTRDDNYFKSFGITMATVCVPFFLLIGSLNTTSGMSFWQTTSGAFVAWFCRGLRRIERIYKSGAESDTPGTAQKSGLVEREIGEVSLVARSRGKGAVLLAISVISLGFLAWFCAILLRRI